MFHLSLPSLHELGVRGSESDLKRNTYNFSALGTAFVGQTRPFSACPQSLLSPRSPLRLALSMPRSI